MRDEDRIKKKLINGFEEPGRKGTARTQPISTPQNDFLHLIINNLRSPVFVKDEKHCWVFLNDAACEMMGHPRDFLLGKTDYDLFPKEQADVFWEKDDLVLLTGEANTNEEEINWGGVVHTILTTKSLIVYPGTGERFIVGVIQDITDRKRAEGELENALIFQRTLMETIPAPLFYKDSEGIYLGCNRAFESFIGVPREEIVGRSVFEIARKDLAKKYHSMDLALLGNGGTQVYEEKVLYADGFEHDVIFRKSTFSNGNGSVAGMVGVMLDISERRRAEARFRQLVDLSPFPISILESDGKYLYLNKKFSEVFGYSLEDIPTGKEWFLKAFPDPEIRKAAISAWIDALEIFGDREVKLGEFSLRCKDGMIREVLFRPVRTEEGLYFITYEDLTELKQAQKVLRESEERYRMIFDHSPLGLMHFDENGVIVDCNRRFIEIHGSSSEAIIGFHMLECLRDEAMRSAVLSAFEGKIGYYEGDYISVTGNKLTTIRALFSRISSDDAHTLGGVCIVEDVTERRQAEKALRESERHLRSLSSCLLTAQEDERKRIARDLHDSLGSSLIAVKMAIENVCRQFERGLLTADCLDIPLAWTQHAVEEVRRVITDLRPSILDDLGLIRTLNWLIERMRSIYTTVRFDQEIGIEERDIPFDLKIVIFRIVQEALNNITKYSQAKYVCISLLEAGAYLELTVEDNGIGFYLQGVALEKATAKGLGLISMKERAELTGGSFSIHSTVGEGTVVRVLWPMGKSQVT